MTTIRPTHRSSYRHSQRGSVLIVSLIMLLMLTILAVSSMSSTTVQERMAYNTHESTRAFATSESGLREGELWIGRPQLALRPISQASGGTCTNPNTNPPCVIWQQTRPNATVGTNTGPWLVATQATGVDRYRDLAWWTNNAVIYNSDGNGSNLPIVASQPSYVIEELFEPGPQPISSSVVMGGSAARRYFYQVSARGVGRATVSEAVMQSVYARIF